MKKIICILLSFVMLLSVMPMTALADEISIGIEDVVNPVDYTAYDSIVAMINGIDKTPYTEDSLKALEDSIADRDSLFTQDDIDSAVKVIAEAYSNLVKKTVSIKFFVINSEGSFTRQDYNYSYGDTATFKVTDTEEKIYKWVKSVNDVDTNLNTQVEELSIIATEDMELVAYTDIAPEIKEQTKQVKFIGANGKTVYIAYTVDVDNVAMPDAPVVPFYDFDGWTKIDDTTYQASYTMNIACGDGQHVFTATVVPPSCVMYGYVFFTCPCGESFYTDYSKPTGHNYDAETGICLNGCGAVAPLDDELASLDENIAPTKPDSDVEKPYENGVDEGGYNTYVLMP